MGSWRKDGRVQRRTGNETSLHNRSCVGVHNYIFTHDDQQMREMKKIPKFTVMRPILRMGEDSAEAVVRWCDETRPNILFYVKMIINPKCYKNQEVVKNVSTDGVKDLKTHLINIRDALNDLNLDVDPEVNFE